MWMLGITFFLTFRPFVARGPTHWVVAVAHGLLHVGLIVPTHMFFPAHIVLIRVYNEKLRSTSAIMHKIASLQALLNLKFLWMDFQNKCTLTGIHC